MQSRPRTEVSTPFPTANAVVFEFVGYDSGDVVRTLTLKTYGDLDPQADMRRVRRMSMRLAGMGYTMAWRTLSGRHGTQGTVRMRPAAARQRRRM
ncbi:hypothetical protein [Pseudomonas oryzihabitans]|uniref:hypothetical protein n=1 Tax=Pseudomonas oryzihabitans TaxID=47885 RepID=UPI0028A9D7F9|nr:hypothetical protein [Pseudomonas oryzihabitans]